MILRRFSKHVTDQNWFAVGLDVIVVVVGIFLGMQVTEWNDSRKDGLLEQQYLSLLLRDLGSINETLSKQITHEEFVLSASPKALAQVNNRNEKNDPLVLGQLLSKIWGRRTLTLDSPIFTELKAAGRLSIISDITLRNSIINYFESLERIERVTEKNNDFVIESYTAFLRDSGIGFVPLPESECGDPDKSVQCLFSSALVDVVNGERSHAVDSILDVPLSDPIWNQLRSQVTHRTLAAISNRAVAKSTLDETLVISELIDNNSVP